VLPKRDIAFIAALPEQLAFWRRSLQRWVYVNVTIAGKSTVSVLFSTVLISRTNAYAQNGLMVYF
jgi:hypothetical protein